jgi:hypothetical protein
MQADETGQSEAAKERLTVDDSASASFVLS